MAEPTIYDYWRIVLKWKGTFTLMFIVTLLSVTVYTMLQPAVYHSEAIITFKPPASYSKIPGSMADEADPRVAVQTEIRVMNSFEIAERAARALGQITDSTAGAGKMKIVSRMRSSYKAEKLPDSNLINVSATGPDPASACASVNAVIESYREYDLEQKSKQAKKTLADIAFRKGEVEESLRSLERQKQNFIERNPNSGLGLTLANQLADLEIKKKQLLEKYTPNHPEFMNLQQRIESVEGKLEGVPLQETGLIRISRELRLQEDLYTTLNKQYEEAKLGLSSVISFVGIIDPAVAGDIPVSPNIRLNLALGCVLGLMFSFLCVFVFENMDISISSIEDIEAILKLPVLGVIPSITAERRLDDWLTYILRRERVTVHSFRSMLLSNKRASGMAMEFYYSLRSSILTHLKRQCGAVVVFSSAGKAEGKTLTTVNFALACVRSGMKTLIVDADIRRPWMHHVLGVDRSPGLSDVLAGKLDWEEAVRDSAAIAAAGTDFPELQKFPGIENLHALSCGSPHSDVTDLMDSADWPALMDEWRKEYDIVIVDAPPVLAFMDSVIVSKHADGVVFVYKSGKMGRDALKRAKEQVLSANARIIGVVLNSVRPSGMGSYYDYY